MKFLVIDPEMNGLDIAWRAQREGHEVRMFARRTPKTEPVGRHMVDVRFSDRASLWSLMQWADLVFLADNNRWMQEIDRFRERVPEKVVVGATAKSAEWELDRQVGAAVFKKVGIPTAPTKEFRDYDEAIAYVLKRDCRLVSKPSGESDKTLSYCAKSPADLVYMLKRWKSNNKLKDNAFILQDFVDGIEMAVGGWFTGHEFLPWWCENWEHKKLMNGELGVATGEQGTVLVYVRKSKLADLVLAPLVGALRRVGHVGYIDINCIIDEKGDAWPLEFTMRPGWPTFNIQQHLHQFMDPILWMKDYGAAGSIIYDKPAVGVVISIPDYPYSHITRKEVTGIPIYGFSDADFHWFSCGECCFADFPDEKDPRKTVRGLATAGDYVGVVHGHNDTVQDARHKVYRRLKGLTIPNSPMYRTDIGLRLSRQLPKLQHHGFARGLKFSDGNS